MVRKINEFNTRLESLLGVEEANTLIAVAESEANSYAMQHKIAPRTTEYAYVVYENVIDGILKRYEARK